MFKPIKQILLATDLTENCRPAFDMAASMATRYQATLVLLHVVEKMSDYLEGRLKSLLGARQWQELVNKNADTARDALIGKKSSNILIQEALEQFCMQEGIDDNACGYHSREIVVADGDVVDEVIKQSKAYSCDLIVMGTHHGFLSQNTVSPKVKNVLLESRIPVMVVPPATASK